MAKKKILFINTLYSPNIAGGAEIIMQEQVEGFYNRGYQVTVLTTGSKKGLEIDEINKIKVYRAGLENVYWNYQPPNVGILKKILWHIKDKNNKAMGRYVRKVIELEKPDIIFCHNLVGWSIAVWDQITKFKIPIVQVLHDLYLMCPSSDMFRNGKACTLQCKQCSLLRLKHPEASKAVDIVVGVSDYIKNRFQQSNYFKNATFLTIHNARNIQDVNVKNSWNQNNPLRIGYIGTISKAKGVEWLIQEFLKLKINATLNISGKGNLQYVNYLKALAHSDNRIFFLGYISPETHYSQINLSVIPSLWPDTFPGVAFESCAYNVPVIASKLGGLPEIIKHGLNGLLCDVNDEASLQNAILELYNRPDLLKKYTANARSSVIDFLNMNRMLNEYENIIEKNFK